jgi:outer membrane protein, multidrug efflux system
MKKILYSMLTFWLMACKSTQISPTPDLLVMPDKFGEYESAAVNSAFSWQSIFTDSSLQQIIQLALTQNLQIAQEQQLLAVAESHILYARGFLIPNLSAANSIGQRRFGKYTMDGVGNFDTNFSPNLTQDQLVPEHLPDFLFGFQSNWEIDVWRRLRNQKEAATARYLQSSQGLKWLKTNIVANTSIFYYQLLALEAELTIINETVALQEQALSIIRLQKMAGKVNELAVNQFEAQALNFKTLAKQREMEMKQLANAFYFILGTYPTAILMDAESLTKDEFQIMIPATKYLLENRPDVKAAEYKLSAQKHDVLAAKAAFYPRLELNALAGFQTFNPSFIFSPQSLTYSLFGSLSAPLLNRRALQAEFNFAEAGKMAAFYEYQQTLLRAYFEVMDQTIAIDALNDIIELKSEEVRVLNNALENSNELFLSGNTNYLEIVVARTNLLQAQLELINANRDQKIAYTNLYRSLGGG